MLKKRYSLALSLVLATLAGTLSPALAEELVVETNKVYTPGTSNGVPGFWVEFKRNRYVKNANHIASPIGRYDATIQEAFAELVGLNRAMTTAEMQQVYTKYGIPTSTNNNYDGGAYHDFNFDAALKQIRADIASGKLKAPSNVAASDVSLMASLANAKDSSALVDVLGASSLDAYIRKAFAFNGGGEYTYTMSDGAHSISYAHGVTYTNPAQFDQAAYDRYKNSGIQSVLLNDPAAFKKLTGMGNIDSYAQAGRFIQMAELIDKGVNPSGLKIDTWVDTTNGPVHVVESQPSAARLRDLARWLVASSWTTHSPIALDLNHDGKIGVTGSSTAQKRLKENKFVANGAVWFDITAEGKKRNIEWLNADGDGFLVDDTNGRVSKAAGGDGMINAHALFGDAIGYANGYHKLAYKATQINLASVLKMNDDVTWSKLYHKNASLKGKTLDTLKVWVDSNRDATVQPKELHTLASLGVTEIGSKPTIRKNQHGEYVIQSYFVQNGKRFMTEDVWFAENPETQAK